MAISYRKRLAGKEQEFVKLVQASGIFHAMEVFSLSGYIPAEAVYKEICEELNIQPTEGHPHTQTVAQSGGDILDSLLCKLEGVVARNQSIIAGKEAEITELKRKLAFYEHGKTDEWNGRLVKIDQAFDQILAGK